MSKSDPYEGRTAASTLSVSEIFSLYLKFLKEFETQTGRKTRAEELMDIDQFHTWWFKQSPVVQDEHLREWRAGYKINPSHDDPVLGYLRQQMRYRA